MTATDIITHGAALLIGCIVGATALALYLLWRAIEGEMDVQHDNRPEDIRDV